MCCGNCSIADGAANHDPIGLNRIMISSLCFEHDRHCEERSDEAIQSYFVTLDCFAPLAMTDTRPHSRGAMRPSRARTLAQEKQRAQESRVPAAPAAPCAKVKPQVHRIHPASPAQWF
jgi:hypothetical protein